MGYFHNRFWPFKKLPITKNYSKVGSSPTRWYIEDTLLLLLLGNAEDIYHSTKAASTQVCQIIN